MSSSGSALRITHSTRFVFDEPVEGGCTLDTRLEPRRHAFHQLIVEPRPAAEQRSTDDHGNATRRLTIDRVFQRLDVTAISTVATEPAPRATGKLLEQRWESLARNESMHDRYRRATARVLPELAADYARRHLRSELTLTSALASLLAALRADFSYDTKATTVDTALSEFVERRRGVCQDFAHFTLACLRSVGLSARYVSGYLAHASDAASNKSAARSHAWVELWLGGDRWLGVDPTLGRIGPLAHVTLARGCDYDDVAPLRGSNLHSGRCRMTTRVIIAAAD